MEVDYDLHPSATQQPNRANNLLFLQQQQNTSYPTYTELLSNTYTAWEVYTVFSQTSFSKSHKLLQRELNKWLN
jgi:hypothetical protein